MELERSNWWIESEQRSENQNRNCKDKDLQQYAYLLDLNNS